MALIDRSSNKFRIISLSVVCIISAIIVKVFIDNWHKIPFDQLSVNYYMLAAAFLFSNVLSSFSAMLWKYTLAILGENPSLLHAWRITVYSQIARYIPGKVWQYMGKVYWGQKVGLSRKNILLSTFLETIFLMAGAFVISLFSLPVFLKKGYFSIEYMFLMTFLIILLLAFLNRKILSFVINILGKKWLSAPVNFTFSYVHIVALVALYSFEWILMGLQLYVFTISFYAIPFSKSIYLTSFNALSWLIGFLSIITPSGLGVKEGIFILGLKTIVPVSFAIICAIIIRLYTIFVDVFITAVFFLFDKGAWKNLIEFRKSSSTIRDPNNDSKSTSEQKQAALDS